MEQTRRNGGGVVAYLPDNQLCFDGPAGRSQDGLPLANGLLGVQLWGEGDGLILSLDRTDLWDLSDIPEYQRPDYTFAEMKRLHDAGDVNALRDRFEQPYYRAAPNKLPAGRIVLTLWQDQTFDGPQSLDAATAIATCHGGLSAYVHRSLSVGVLALPAGTGVEVIAPPFGGQPDGFVLPADPVMQMISHSKVWDLGYDAPCYEETQTGCGFRQSCAAGFEFAVWLDRLVQPDGRVLAVWTIQTNQDGGAALDRAREVVADALAQGAAALRASHVAAWADWWAQGGVTLPDQDLQDLWCWEMYKFGAATHADAPPMALQGPWTTDNGMLPPWKGDYHHNLNTQLCYWPAYTGNRLADGLPFLEWLWQTRDTCRDWTKRFFEAPGLNVPMTADIKNRQLGGWLPHTHSMTVSAWLSHHFWLHWRYSMDHQFLQDRAYPYMAEVAAFLAFMSAERDADGYRRLPFHLSPEYHDNKPEAWFEGWTNYDLACCRFVFGAAAQMADALDLADEAAQHRAALAEFPSFIQDEEGGYAIAEGQALELSHRHHSHLQLFHPFALVDKEHEGVRAALDLSLARLDRLGTLLWAGFSFSWRAGLYARLGNGDRAVEELRIFQRAFTLPSTFHCNGDPKQLGYCAFAYDAFTLEGNMAAASAVHDMLLQSFGACVELFPAVPDAWNSASFEHLRAEGGLLVSAQLVGDEIKAQVIAARSGQTAFKNGRTGKLVTVDHPAGQVVELMV